ATRRTICEVPRRSSAGLRQSRSPVGHLPLPGTTYCVQRCGHDLTRCRTKMKKTDQSQKDEKPQPPSGLTELTDQELEQVQGGMSWGGSREGGKPAIRI